jgi:hypothetical protein
VNKFVSFSIICQIKQQAMHASQHSMLLAQNEIFIDWTGVTHGYCSHITLIQILIIYVLYTLHRIGKLYKLKLYSPNNRDI